MSQFFSDKIKVMSLLAIILVLYIHSGFHDLPNEIQGMTANFMLQEFVSGMIGRCAVPMFFALSGYLFFRNIETWRQLWEKVRKRVRTLLVPYLIAAWFPALFYLALEYVPGVSGFVNGGGFSENFSLSAFAFLKMMYWDAGNGSPYAFHLWFLRDLIIIVACCPVLFQVLRFRAGKYVLLALLFALSLLDAVFNPAYGMFWFVAGHCFLERMNRIKGLMTIVCGVTFLSLSVFQLLYEGEPWNCFRIPIVALGVVTMWTVYDRVVPRAFELREHKWLLTACSYTFFIYLYHEPTLNIVRKVLVIPFHHSSFGFALSYMLSPWLFAALWILVGVVMQRFVPRVYGVCVGGR